VLGRVETLAVERAAGPLLFFKGVYGHFAAAADGARLPTSSTIRPISPTGRASIGGGSPSRAGRTGWMSGCSTTTMTWGLP